MKQLTCEMCGGTDIVKDNGYWVCQTCGCKYSPEEAKKMMIEGTVDVSGSTVQIDNSAYIERYLQNARRAKGKEDWAEVEKYYNLVEQNDPTNIEAIFYSAYGKAKLALVENNEFKRRDAFKVLSNSISIIDDNFDIEKDNKDIIMGIANDLFDMKNSEFVYTERTHTQHVKVGERYIPLTNTTDDKYKTYALFNDLIRSFRETLTNIIDKYKNDDRIKDNYYLIELVVKCGIQGELDDFLSRHAPNLLYEKALSNIKNNKDEEGIKQLKLLKYANYKFDESILDNAQNKLDEIAINRAKEILEISINSNHSSADEIKNNLEDFLRVCKDTDKYVDLIKESKYQILIKNKTNVKFYKYNKEIIEDLKDYKDTKNILNVIEEANKKYTKKMTVMRIIAGCVCLSFILIFFVILPSVNLAKYNTAIELINNKNYEEAADILVGLKGYDNSDEILNKYIPEDIVFKCKAKIISADHKKAIELIDEEKYEEAADILIGLKGYGGADEILNKYIPEDIVFKCKVKMLYPDNKKLLELIDEKKYEDVAKILISLKGDNVTEEIYETYIPLYIKLKYSKIGSNIRFGSFEQDNNPENGKETIDWIILEKNNNKAMLISKYCLDSGIYHYEKSHVSWKICSLRYWLNKTFFKEAFNQKEQKSIINTYVIADKNPEHPYNNPGENTIDKVFIPSIPEVNKYFGLNLLKSCKPSEYAISRGIYTFDGNCKWWLRSPGRTLDEASYVRDDGDIYWQYVTDDSTGVRPAIWVEY